MEWSMEMELNLIELNQLMDLAHDLRVKFKSTSSEMSKRYESHKKAIESWIGETPDPISFRRTVESYEIQRLRLARRTIFASGYSAAEHFLLLRTPKCKGTENFKTLTKNLIKALGEDVWNELTFRGEWERLDMYRVARNKILHQSGFVRIEDVKNPNEKEHLSSPARPVFLEDVQEVEGLQKVVIEESFLGEYLQFLQNLALDVDRKLRGVETC